MPWKRSRILHVLGLIAVIALTLFPFYWMLSSSLKTQTDLLASPPVWWFTPTLANYQDVYADGVLLRAVGNSLIVAIFATILSVKSAPPPPSHWRATTFAARPICGSGSSPTG